MSSRLKHKRGRPSNYRKKLQKNKDWLKVKRKVRIRDNFQCVQCESKINLETHHLSYTKNGVSIVGKELEYLECLITVCETCHEEIHRNKKNPLNPINYKWK